MQTEIRTIFLCMIMDYPGFDSTLLNMSYYRRAGSDYFEWIDMGSYVGMTAPLWMEYTFLKDNQAVGGTWQSAPFTGQYCTTSTSSAYLRLL